MESCAYENCLHISTCAVCNLCTNGSQVHGACLSKYNSEMDNEISELLASATESLPTEEQENEAIALQRDTPISMWEDMETDEELDYEVHYHEIVKTDVDIVGDTLAKAYPHEDFNSDAFQRISIHAYLTCEMSKMEFFIAHNQWGKNFCYYPKETPIRMRKGIVSRYNTSTEQRDVYHISCIDTEASGFIVGGFCKALLTVEARDRDQFIQLVVGAPEAFFCKYCEKFMFDRIDHESEKQFAIPNKNIWPECDSMLFNGVHEGTEEKTYVEIKGHVLIHVVVSPQDE